MSENNNITPLPFDGIGDYHVHCDFSVDATGSVDDYCRMALKRNLAEICFTTHYDANEAVRFSDNFIRINGQEKRVSSENLKPYVDTVIKANDEFYPQGLLVKLGLEFGWFEGCEEKAIELKELYDFDYFLCGFHQMENRSFWRHGEKKGSFDIYNLEQFIEKYFKQLVKATHTGLFDCIAHVDYYKRKAYQHYGDKVAGAHLPYLKELFKALLESGTAIEINTSALRHGNNGNSEFYPDVAFINSAKKSGVDVVRLGSDAHRPEDVGFNFEAAVPLIPNPIVDYED